MMQIRDLFSLFVSKVIFILLAWGFSVQLAYGSVDWFPSRGAANDGFVVHASVYDHNHVYLEWKIAKGYHLYRNKISVRAAPDSSAVIGAVFLPPGVKKYDSVLGHYQLYTHELDLMIPVIHRGNGTVKLDVSYQGCMGTTLCYPPVTKSFTLQLGSKGDVHAAPVAVSAQKYQVQPVEAKKVATEDATYVKTLKHKSVGLILLIFFGVGILLSLTPCVLPMVPILSSLIIGQKQHLTMHRGFALSLSYVLGMAIAYAIAGVLAGLLGRSIQVALQTPVAILVMAVIFVLLALAMAGVFQLQLPDKVRSFFHNLSARQKGGTYVGAAVMGFLSALVVTPCISAPLIGVLTYLASTGNVMLSALVLFVMGLGMGVPLIILGTLGGRFMPKAGAWMIMVQRLFAVLLLAMACWLLSRIIPIEATHIIAGVLIIILSGVLGVFSPIKSATSLFKAMLYVVSLVVLVYGVCLLIAVITHNDRLYRSLVWSSEPQVSISDHVDSSWDRVDTIAGLEHWLHVHRNDQKPVMLDFYATWCASCQELKGKTFVDPSVQTMLKHYNVLEVDVSRNDQSSIDLMHRYQVIGPPTIMFLDASYQVVKGARMVGYVPAKQFYNTVKGFGLIKR